ncbi:hypothetical protein ACFXKX_37300 [Streptomyces scopuliridis]|uniref:hypothetical protein n=1 Tax=Streptomyces scopuliridis TaxID=452529 RepID=UPI0036AEFBB7
MRELEQVKVFCGIDWASDHHDIAVVNESGTLKARARIDDTIDGLNELLRGSRLASLALADLPAQPVVELGDQPWLDASEGSRGYSGAGRPPSGALLGHGAGVTRVHRKQGCR